MPAVFSRLTAYAVDCTLDDVPGKPIVNGVLASVVQDVMELEAEGVLAIVVHPGGGDFCLLLQRAMVDRNCLRFCCSLRTFFQSRQHWNHSDADLTTHSCGPIITVITGKRVSSQGVPKHIKQGTENGSFVRVLLQHLYVCSLPPIQHLPRKKHIVGRRDSSFLAGLPPSTK